MNLEQAKSYVGPPDRFDLIGQYQLKAAKRYGLKPHHTLLDWGCGCLRGGHYLMDYLEPDHYTGWEPNAELLTLGQEHYAIKEKRPRLSTDYPARIPYDYIWAYSIWSHAGPDLLATQSRQLLDHASPTTVLLSTVLLADTGRVPANGWHYPHTISYGMDTLKRLLEPHWRPILLPETDHPTNQRFIQCAIS